MSGTIESITCTAVFTFCQSGAQNGGGSSSCVCILTNQQESFCTTSQFICQPNYANVTCQVDNDCYNAFGESYAGVSMEGCATNTPCSGSGGTRPDLQFVTPPARDAIDPAAPAARPRNAPGCDRSRAIRNASLARKNRGSASCSVAAVNAVPPYLLRCGMTFR